MKRPHESEDEEEVIPVKRRRVNVVTPHASILDLAHLSFLRRYVFDVDFCVCTKKGISQRQSKCDLCSVTKHTESQTENIEQAMTTFKSLLHEDNLKYLYIVDVIIRELFHLGAKKVDIGQDGVDIKLRVETIQHVSSFLIQLLLTHHIVKDVLIDMVSGEVCIIFSNQKQCTNNDVVYDSILNSVVGKVKRNILSLSQQSELLGSQKL